MQCRRCRAELPDDAKYCLKCGARQDMSRKPKARGNGTGSAYQMPNRTWKAVCVVGWRADADVVITPSSNRTLVCQGRVITKHRFPLPD